VFSSLTPSSLLPSFRDYRLRLILCLVDDANNKEPLLEIIHTAPFLPPSLPLSLPPPSLRDYRLRLILCLVDDANNKEPLLEINNLAIRENCTLLLAWSTAEAAR